MKDEKEAKIQSAEDTEMLPEYDFESMEMHQGRTFERMRGHDNNRLLAPDLAAEFQDSEAVNESEGDRRGVG